MALNILEVLERQPCHVARSQAEREAIYRQRYEIYVIEQGRREAPGVDHQRRRLA